MFCDNCGQALPDNSTICKFCGQTIAAAAAVGAAPSFTTPTASSLPVGVARTREDTGAFFVLPISRTVLGALERGSVIRKAVTLALRILGILLVLSGIYLLVQILKYSFQMGVPTQFTLGGLILAVLIAAGIFGMMQVCFYRAGTISGLGESPFTVMPVISILLRAFAEAYAVALATLGVGGCLFIWFSGTSPTNLLGFMGSFVPLPEPQILLGNSQFLDGLGFLVAMALIAFAFLVLFYFLAELVVVLADIAKNVRVLVKTGEKAL